MKFFKCIKCNRLAVFLDDMNLTSCGEVFEEVTPNTTDAATEKHVPVVEVSGNKVVVKVGEVEHPMTEEHYIQWIALQTKWNFYFRFLDPGKPAKGTMDLCSKDEVVAVYAYCNLHGLWKA